jgi:hypothetical protein
MKTITLPRQPIRVLPAYSEYQVDGALVKLYHDRVSLKELQRQTDDFLRARGAGLPVCDGDAELVQIAGDSRYGQLFAANEGTWLSDAYLQKPLKVGAYARIMAEQHRRIHQMAPIAGLASQREVLKGKILCADIEPSAIKRSVVSLLNRLPHGNSVCHGDFQPFSVLLGAKALLICNWKDVTNGNPLCDVARTALIMTCTVPGGSLRARGLRAYLNYNNRLYLSAYLRKESGHETELEAWMVINAAARLSEDVPEKERLLKIIKRSLPRVMARYCVASAG